MKKIRKTISMALAGMLFVSLSVASCTKAVEREDPQDPGKDDEKEDVVTPPAKPGPITKTPSSLECVGGSQFQFSVAAVEGADSYEWTIVESQEENIWIVEGQNTNAITVEVTEEACEIPANTVSVVAVNKVGKSDAMSFGVALTVTAKSDYNTKLYGNKEWMVENCREDGEDGNLGRTVDIVNSGSTLDVSVLQRLNEVQGRYYTWYEAMTGISGCTPEQFEEKIASYNGVDDAGNAFALDGGESELGAQIQGCCPEGWHIANGNDWWDLLQAVKAEYNVPDDFVQGGYTFNGGHDGKPENAPTKESFYLNGCTVKNMGNVGAWLRGGNGIISEGGVWENDVTEASDAGEVLALFVSGADQVGFNWYPLAYFKSDGSFNYTNCLGRYGYVWFIGQQDENYARSLCISGRSMNLSMMNTKRSEAEKSAALQVRCVKNY